MGNVGRTGGGGGSKGSGPSVILKFHFLTKLHFIDLFIGQVCTVTIHVYTMACFIIFVRVLVGKINCFTTYLLL